MSKSYLGVGSREQGAGSREQGAGGAGEAREEELITNAHSPFSIPHLLKTNS
ncbi:hypothetical protein [Nostoc sp.]|uniref:hypothetical protein n=1 Tax=Nostoc sp. TaxID=1180 RepID=UPI002FF5143C